MKYRYMYVHVYGTHTCGSLPATAQHVAWLPSVQECGEHLQLNHHQDQTMHRKNLASPKIKQSVQSITYVRTYVFASTHTYLYKEKLYSSDMYMNNTSHNLLKLLY